MQGDVLLKTYTNNFKQRYMILMGNELFFQKKKDSENHEFMHLMKGTFLELKDSFAHEFSQGEETQVYPLKIILGPQKTRVLYFTD